MNDEWSFDIIRKIEKDSRESTEELKKTATYVELMLELQQLARQERKRISLLQWISNKLKQIGRAIMNAIIPPADLPPAGDSQTVAQLHATLADLVDAGHGASLLEVVANTGQHFGLSPDVDLSDDGLSVVLTLGDKLP